MYKTCITGDIHGDLSRIHKIIKDHYLDENDMIIILGDVGFNYYLSSQDKRLKKITNEPNFPKLFCVRGNHEARPSQLESMKTKCIDTEFFKGNVYYEPDYPNIYYAVDGAIYRINNKTALTIGGAYSIDKHYRLYWDLPWFSDEQLNSQECDNIMLWVKHRHFDLVLSHTCHFKWIPTELFIPDIDQSKVDNTMEYWLDEVEENIKYEHWYFGHFHGNKEVNDKVTMLYTDVVKL